MAPFLLALLPAAVAVSAPARARAEETTHVAVGVGGWFAPVQADAGLWAGTDFWPGGLWGARLDGYADASFAAFMIEASALRQLGAARPHLVVALHVGGGVALPDPAVLAGAGLATDLGLKLGPLALTLDVTGRIAAWSDRLDLVLTSTLGLKAAW
jgi:hypothetical protein